MRTIINGQFGAHQSFKNMMAHYLSPLHLCSGLIQLAYKTKRHPVRYLLLRCVHYYDMFYRNVIRLA